MSENPKFTYKDMQSDQEVRWCPGCDDYVILRAVQKALPEIGKKKEDIVFISGIGCSSRFPYYVETFGMHSIHGRAPAIATGVKLANPDLSVWVITGDGDSMAIGGNHFIHLIRRNVDLNLILFNNEIYGLTKGQFSPTSALDLKTKSSPFGNIHQPFSTGELALGANARFFARIAGNNPKAMTALFVEAEKFRGTSIIEVLQNCVIFNDGVFDKYLDRKVKNDAQLMVEHGEPMLFGKELDKGLILNGLNLEVVKIGENGITQEDILIHDAQAQDKTMHQMLIRLNMPVVLGVIRAVEEVSFHQRMQEKTALAIAKSKVKNIDDLLYSGGTYEVE
jgi:2-oxoglutarate ferredoxin oxidoreductase subunit beta